MSETFYNIQQLKEKLKINQEILEKSEIDLILDKLFKKTFELLEEMAEMLENLDERTKN
ncbi:32916_t:CDS:2 [Gigaspora margarita]|uniref:32916_t:CDS:1 n=1 Tax=Gigaspora margarita TaxID=4874 RepID=A0ABN7V3I5_GIGMA|nr:32916_t:CDS:2 [Gigaspora margarita]